MLSGLHPGLHTMTAAAEKSRIRVIAVALMAVLILLPCAHFLLREETRRETLRSHARQQALLTDQVRHDLENAPASPDSLDLPPPSPGTALS